MNPFLLSPNERLTDWREFRKSLTGDTITERMEKVAAYFCRAPLAKLAYDSEAAQMWPTPWEMIHRGEWDRDILAVGMEATLRLSGIEADRLQLCIMQVAADATLRMVVLVDGVWVLNYDWGRVTSLPASYHIRRRWHFNGRSYSDF